MQYNQTLQELYAKDEADEAAGRPLLFDGRGLAMTMWDRCDAVRPDDAPIDATPFHEYTAQQTPDGSVWALAGYPSPMFYAMALNLTEAPEELQSMIHEEAYILDNPPGSVVRERHVVFPGSADPQEFAERHRAGLPYPFCDFEATFFLAPGERVVYSVAEGKAAVDAGLDTDSSWGNDDRSRDRKRVWRMPPGTHVVHLAARGATAKSTNLDDLQAVSAAPADTAQTGIPTGIPELDTVLTPGGLLPGLTVVMGPPSAGKTTLCLAVACGMAEAGYDVAWYAAGDESLDRIQERLRARGGKPDKLLLLDRSRIPLDRCLIPELGALFLDSIQGHSGSSHYDVEELLRHLKTAPCPVVALSQVNRAGLGKGSSDIEYGANLQLKISRKRSKVTAHVLKSRDGGEGTVFEIADLDPVGLSRVPVVERRIRRDIIATLTASPQSKTWLREHIRGNDATILGVLEAMLERGELTRQGRKLVLAS